ncbi:MAG TPA: prolyl oligopeptidase family serine peptidase, partial [Planctomycetota bacterium]|nr:prolyl oligopeptidase family serine peptidase [Planctomycetota bacterium]
MIKPLCLWIALVPLTQDRPQLEREWGELRLRAAGDADVAVFAKAVEWALKYQSNLSPEAVSWAQRSLARGRRRTEDREGSWTRKKGKVLRGFRSGVDQSIQPYGLIIPAAYDPEHPIRLDVVLHGSQVPDGLSELRFLNQFDDGDDSGARGPERDFIELHPLGRVENGYRWAGETDVFEAIEATCRNYAIDRRRVVLRGMSMGASGTWHLGLKRPDVFVALAPYAGYVDTHQFSETPLKTFVKVGPLPTYQEKTLSMLDSVDYAANAGMVPAVACIGEKDVFFECHQIMGRALKAEGLEPVNLISPGTGHVIDPATHREQMRRVGEFAAKGRDDSPRHVRFVTWTLKYSRCFWLEVLRLREHYARSEIDARLSEPDTLDIAEPRNISCFAIHPPLTGLVRIRVGKTEIPVPESARRGSILVEDRDGAWSLTQKPPTEGKRPGLQGPIDDAFAGSFLCVRGTGTPWNVAVHSRSEEILRQFSEEWSYHFRGELPVKDDARVTEDDVRKHHLILFGDPGSNRWIAQALPNLPL